MIDNMIRWPRMQCYDNLVFKRDEAYTTADPPIKVDLSTWECARHWTVVQRDWDRDVLWLAPRWIGWLYRLLPNHFNVNLTAWKTEPSHFLVNFGAPTWYIGLAMRGRERKFPVPAIVLDLGTACKHHYYLPWGVRLYRRLVMPRTKGG